MPAEHICICKICHVQDIKRSEMKEGVDYIHNGNVYYHKKCYDEWKNSTPATDEEYKAFIYDFLTRDLKVSYNWYMCEAQIKKFVKEGLTIKGTFLTLKYFYEIKHGDWKKGYGGLGIVPFMYQEAAQYWHNREQKEHGIIAGIERQMRERAQQKQKVIIQPKVEVRKTVDLSFDEGDEE